LNFGILVLPLEYDLFLPKNAANALLDALFNIGNISPLNTTASATGTGNRYAG
jgi:hypothetical protein